MPQPSVALRLGGSLGRVAFLVAFCVLVVAALALQFATVRALYGGSESAERINCPSCGARTAVDSETCAYCGEAVESRDDESEA